MPCKHLLAVLEHVEGFSWDTLPQTYRESPFFNLDDCVINPIECGIPEAKMQDQNPEPTPEPDQIYPNLQKQTYPKRSKAAEC